MTPSMPHSSQSAKKRSVPKRKMVFRYIINSSGTLDEGDDVACEKREECVTLILWKKINDAICSVVDHITLQDLVDWQREKNGDYVI